MAHREDNGGIREPSVEAYTLKSRWQRNDVKAVVAAGPVILSVGWKFATWKGLIWGSVAVVCLELFLHLLGFWINSVYCWIHLNRQNDPTKAQVVTVNPHVQNSKVQICQVKRAMFGLQQANQKSEKEKEVTFFDFWHTRYIYDEDAGQFKRLTFDPEFEFSFHTKNSGYGKEATVESALKKWGPNEFRFSKPDFLPMLGQQMLAPFFVFQLFCVALWCLDEYWYYCLFTLVMLVLFECTVVKQRLRNLDTLRGMGHKPQSIMAQRGGRWVQVSEQMLLPGDVISIGGNKISSNSTGEGSSETFVPADCLLLAGNGITNESILTGESIPQWKVPVSTRNPNEKFSWKRDKQHTLYRGTTLIQVQPDATARVKTPDGGILAEVMRTGFSTTQGDLMRVILNSTERMSANSAEAGLFILFLLVFALAASGYVLYHGLYNPDRDLFKLALNCVMIITSVVPPELPMELSLAVNTSMLNLFKCSIFCTEPFRIPSAGKVDVCCFDKTGTLTASRLIFEGIGHAGTNLLEQNPELPDDDSDAMKVLAGCHSLVAIDGKLKGDPMEKAAFKRLSWTLVKNVAKPKGRSSTKGKSIHIVRRFHFNPVLKRMSTIIAMEPETDGDREYYAVAKGAPEDLTKCLSSVPKGYMEAYTNYACRGYRVLALAVRKMNHLDWDAIRTIDRSEVESNLHFCGFAVFSCPLKPTSRDTLLSLKQAQHRLVMITGDAMLTACHTAQEVHIGEKLPLILQINNSTKQMTAAKSRDDEAFAWSDIEWASRDGDIEIAFDAESVCDLSRDYTLCVPGKVVSMLSRAGPGSTFLKDVIPYCSVYARTSPDEKEIIVKTLKDVGHTVLMCGDGTNDVGALKASHVGIALLNSKPINFRNLRKSRKKKKRTDKHSSDWVSAALEEEDDALPMVSLGDASIASPFTARHNTVTPCIDIIKQGRSTLVTYIQMFKILGINCLSSAYSMSVMYLNGVKMGDTQATVSGVIIAFLFMFLSNSKPHKELSSKRPHSRVFCRYMFFSILGQFALHLLFIVGTYRYATSMVSEADGDVVEALGDEGNHTIELEQVVNNATETGDEIAPKDGDFQPNIVNTVAYLVNFMIQLSTFAVNYAGEPFNVSMWQNKGLIYGLIVSAIMVAMLILGFMESLNTGLELVPLPAEMKAILLSAGFATWVFSFGVERCARLAFPEKLHQNLL